MKYRIGFGFDVHQMAEGRPCWLGGILIEHPTGPLGHSDADVLIHAICDALLGAANLRDIGYHFSDKDAKFKGIDSKILLAEVTKMLKDRNYAIGNVDCTLVLEAPKINPHIEAMQACLAEIMGISTEDISIKATTNEKMGFIGRQEGVVAHAVTIIEKL